MTDRILVRSSPQIYLHDGLLSSICFGSRLLGFKKLAYEGYDLYLFNVALRAHIAINASFKQLGDDF